MVTHEAEPFLLQFVHEDLKHFVGDGAGLFLRPLGIDCIEPLLVCRVRIRTSAFTHLARPCHTRPAPQAQIR